MAAPTHEPTDVTPATVEAVRRSLDGRWRWVREEIRGRTDLVELWSEVELQMADSERS